MRNEPMRRNDLPETCFSILPSSGQLIIIRCGERGYYPSEWDTGKREENREIASSHNARRGIMVSWYGRWAARSSPSPPLTQTVVTSMRWICPRGMATAGSRW